MKNRGFAQYILIMAVILAVIFLSQQPYFSGIGKNIYNQAESWVMTNIYPRVVSEVEKRGEEVRGEEVREEVSRQKDNLMKNVWQKIKKYFSNIFTKTTGTEVE